MARGQLTGLCSSRRRLRKGEAVPLRYVVPPNIAIELWDSGMPVFARPGDALLTLAAFHHMPLWSLAQINQVSERTPLVPGQRVVVPRHLVPLATAPGGRRPGADLRVHMGSKSLLRCGLAIRS